MCGMANCFAITLVLDCFDGDSCKSDQVTWLAFLKAEYRPRVACRRREEQAQSHQKKPDFGSGCGPTKTK